jgi:hypothetical protein
MKTFKVTDNHWRMRYSWEEIYILQAETKEDCLQIAMGNGLWDEILVEEIDISKPYLVVDTSD